MNAPPSHAELHIGRSARGSGPMLGWCALAALLIVNVPLALALPLTADTALYDVQVQSLHKGAILYRDLFEPNLPGIIWIQSAIRSLVGWSTVAMQAVDLLIVAAIATLLLWQTRTAPDVRRRWPWLAGALLLCYCSTSEWCRAQRDIWMLLPALVAVSLRIRRMAVHRTGTLTPRSLLLSSLVEGLLWGAAFWIKPHVALPAIACAGIGALSLPRRLALREFAGLLTGGLLIGAAGAAWLVAHGAWPYFWDTLWNWNPQYVASGRARWSLDRLLSMHDRLFPWLLIHLAALPLAVRTLMHRPSAAMGHSDGEQTAAAVDSRRLLSGVYLAWTLQAFAVQQLFDYVHVPGLLLGIAVIAVHWPAALPARRGAAWATCLFAVLALGNAPTLRPQRLGAWWTCVTQGTSPELQNRLQQGQIMDWVDLQQVIGYLRSQNVRDGELTCYSGNLVHVYRELGVQPSTRYTYLDVLARIFPEQRDEMLDLLADSPQRYVVSNLIESGMPLDAVTASDATGQLLDSTCLPPAFPAAHRDEFPWTQPVVFRAGRYVVHRAHSPLGTLSTYLLPLAPSPAPSK